MSNNENITQSTGANQHSSQGNNQLGSQQSNQQKSSQRSQRSQQHNDQNNATDEIDLMSLFGALLDRKFFICVVTAIFIVIGVTVALFATPIYQATAMIQVEESGGSVPGLDDMAGMFEASSKSVTEIELLKSRSVIGEAVDKLQLDIVVTPKLFPIIGKRNYRVFDPISENEIAEVKYGAETYAWGGEKIDIFRFDVPNKAIGKSYLVQTGTNNNFTLLSDEGEKILSGKVGEEVTNGNITLTIKQLIARPGTEFILSRKDRLNTILSLQGAINASEKGQDSGIVDLSFEHANPAYAQTVLNEISKIYVRRNVERNSAEAKKSLDFLEVQLPAIKRELEASEAIYNDYQKNQQSVNISLETQGVLEQIVKLETKLQELDLERLALSRKFKRTHPIYKGIIEQIAAVESQRDSLAQEVTNLPATQQKLLGLARDVEVSNEIYMMLLGKVQELDVIRAGTVGNVRIIDIAEVNTSRPVKPRKALIVVMATMLGGMLAVAIVLVQKALHKGVEDPTEIEAIGLSVYATVPYSTHQDKLSNVIKTKARNVKSFNKNRKADKSNQKAQNNKSAQVDKTAQRKASKQDKNILAVDNPADLSIEALRSLRTSLHFIMMEAKNNVIAISGPSPSVGKSFISANLGTVLAQSGQKVLVIDADMRKGYLQKYFGVERENGLSDYLSGQQTLKQVTKATTIEGLSVITRGQVPPNPSELLMHENFSHLINDIKAEYDIVLIDTPPILAVTDPAIVGGQAGSVLMVTRFGENSIKEIDYACQRFEQNGIDVKGVVFNGVLKKASNTYGYYNYEYKSDT